MTREEMRSVICTHIVRCLDACFFRPFRLYFSNMAFLCIVKHPQILGNERTQSVIKGLNLCFDLMMAFGKRSIEL